MTKATAVKPKSATSINRKGVGVSDSAFEVIHASQAESKPLKRPSPAKKSTPSASLSGVTKKHARSKLVGKFPDLPHFPAPAAPLQLNDSDFSALLKGMALT